MVTPIPGLRERRAFVDSSAYLALLDEDDEHRSDAVEIVARLAGQRFRQYTTNVILVESHALIMSTLGITRAAEFLRGMDQSNTVIVRARASDEQRAKAILFQYGDKDFSFADAISFSVIERLRIPHAFTFDRHFVQYGLNVLAR